MRAIHLLLPALLLSGSAFAAEKTDVMVPLHQFVDGFNKGDVKSALAACASPAYIIDEFAPYQWSGANACADWANDYEKNAKANGITDGVVKILKATTVDVSGDHAYVIARTSYDWKEKGKAMHEKSATLTAALHKEAAGWRMTAWTWSK